MPPSIHESARRESRMLRALSLLLYAGVVALGEALVARPALLFLRGLGISHAVLPWRVPFGALQLVLALGVAICAIWLAAALGRPRRLKLHTALLLMLALALGVRSQTAAPQPPADPLPALLTGLRTAAVALEQGANPAEIDAELARLGPPGFVRFGRRLPMRMSSDVVPGTILLSRDEHVARLTVRTENGLAMLSGGRPAMIEVRGGTHSEPGRDPLLPAYPGMRSIAAEKP
jgi:hypothetical protein